MGALRAKMEQDLVIRGLSPLTQKIESIKNPGVQLIVSVWRTEELCGFSNPRSHPTPRLLDALEVHSSAKAFALTPQQAGEKLA